MDNQIDAMELVNYYREKVSELEYQLGIVTIALKNATEEFRKLKDAMGEAQE